MTPQQKDTTARSRPLLLQLAAIVGVACALGSPCPAKTRPIVETVLRSAPLYGTNGLTVDREDHLIIAAINPKAVLVMDTNTGQILKKYTHPLITSPDDVAMGPDGSIYYTDLFSGNIGRISPTGEVTLVANLGAWTNSIRVSPDGSKLYVGHCIGADRLTEIDLAGKSEPRVVAENVGWPNSMSFGPDGRLYSPLNIRNQVIRWNLETGDREVVYVTDSTPSSVKFDSQGRMLLTEFALGRLTRVDLKTHEREIISDKLPRQLDNVALDSKGRMFVASNAEGGILEVFEDGHTKELSPTGMLVPSGLAILQAPAGEQLVVADYWTLRYFDTTSFDFSRIIYSGFYPFAKFASGPKADQSVNLGFPITVAYDRDALIITSWHSNAVHVFDTKLNRVTRTIDGNYPLYAMRFGDRLVVSEFGSHSVVAIAADGKRDTLVGIAVPTGLVAKRENLWAADWSKGEVLQVISNGKVLATPKVLARGLEQPEGMAVAKDGSLLVVESGVGRLVKINPANGEKRVLAEGLKTGKRSGHQAPPSYLFSAVAVGADGSVYVSCDDGNEVVRVRE